MDQNTEVIDIEALDARLHPKFSPNLYGFLRAQKRKGFLQNTSVFRDATGTLWIGYLDDGYLIGARLVSVLCNGARTTRWAFGGIKGLIRIDDFWSNYTRDGRCAIDPDHQMHFLNDESRWTVSGDRRSCCWCGNAEQWLHHSTKVVKTDHWANFPGDASTALVEEGRP